ncbi:unnamed protein product [Acanthoscelides obtectus]|uniref:Uncharacterized protein n=1 Tax=Acanthoscelides obtectus TaxID=200917 RepID=A0A9P0K3I1_ACAOB|nr:unnamed protein product [Acanthoscelides obtectus]CAK1646164.1 hypothetical protein AOBTE_LOCUS14488 [Acanthoscelides obtectus]
MALLFFEVFSMKINTHLYALEPIFEALIPLVCWQIQNGIFECVNCFFW